MNGERQKMHMFNQRRLVTGITFTLVLWKQQEETRSAKHTTTVASLKIPILPQWISNVTHVVLLIHQWVLEYLVVPGQAVEAQPTPSGISTLQIQAVQVKTGQNPGGVVYDRWKMKDTYRRVINLRSEREKTQKPNIVKSTKGPHRRSH